MYYNIKIDGEHVGLGLSYGELCQWLIDLDKELEGEDTILFRKSLGYKEGDFEEFLYSSNTMEVPMIAKFGKEILTITECEF